MKNYYTDKEVRYFIQKLFEEDFDDTPYKNHPFLHDKVLSTKNVPRIGRSANDEVSNKHEDHEAALHDMKLFRDLVHKDNQHLGARAYHNGTANFHYHMKTVYKKAAEEAEKRGLKSIASDFHQMHHNHDYAHSLHRGIEQSLRNYKPDYSYLDDAHEAHHETHEAKEHDDAMMEHYKDPHPHFTFRNKTFFHLLHSADEHFNKTHKIVIRNGMKRYDKDTS